MKIEKLKRSPRPYSDIELPMQQSGRTVIQWVGPKQPTAKYQSYVRLELKNADMGEYLGSLSDRQAKLLMRRLMKYYGVSQ